MSENFNPRIEVHNGEGLTITLLPDEKKFSTLDGKESEIVLSFNDEDVGVDNQVKYKNNPIGKQELVDEVFMGQRPPVITFPTDGMTDWECLVSWSLSLEDKWVSTSSLCLEICDDGSFNSITNQINLGFSNKDKDLGFDFMLANLDKSCYLRLKLTLPNGVVLFSNVVRVKVTEKVIPLNKEQLIDIINNGVFPNKIDTKKITDLSYFWCQIDDSVKDSRMDGMDNWNTSNVTNMKYVFGYPDKTYQGTNNLLSKGYSDITRMPLGWDTSNVTDMEGIFRRCLDMNAYPGLEELKNWNTSNVENFSYAFSEYDSFIDEDLGLSKNSHRHDRTYVEGVNSNFLANLDTRSCKRFDYMFYKFLIKGGPFDSGARSFDHFEDSTTDRLPNVSYVMGYSFFFIGYWDMRNAISIEGMFKYSRYANNVFGKSMPLLQNANECFYGCGGIVTKNFKTGHEIRYDNMTTIKKCFMFSGGFSIVDSYNSSVSLTSSFKLDLRNVNHIDGIFQYSKAPQYFEIKLPSSFSNLDKFFYCSKISSRTKLVCSTITSMNEFLKFGLADSISELISFINSIDYSNVVSANYCYFGVFCLEYPNSVYTFNFDKDIRSMLYMDFFFHVTHYQSYIPSYDVLDDFEVPEDYALGSTQNPLIKNANAFNIPLVILPCPSIIKNRDNCTVTLGYQLPGRISVPPSYAPLPDIRNFKNTDEFMEEHFDLYKHYTKTMIIFYPTRINSSNVKSVKGLFAFKPISSITSFGLSSLPVSVTNIDYLFVNLKWFYNTKCKSDSNYDGNYSGSKLNTFLNSLTNNNIESMKYAFMCYSGTFNNFGRIIKSSTTDVEGMLMYSTLEVDSNFNSADTRNVKNMSYIFYELFSYVPQNISNWNVSNVTTLKYGFYSGSGIESGDGTGGSLLLNGVIWSNAQFNFSNWNLVNCENIDFAFVNNHTSWYDFRIYGNIFFDRLPQYDMPKLLSMESAFQSRSGNAFGTKTYSNWVMSRVINAKSAFAYTYPDYSTSFPNMNLTSCPDEGLTTFCNSSPSNLSFSSTLSSRLRSLGILS